MAFRTTEIDRPRKHSFYPFLFGVLLLLSAGCSVTGVPISAGKVIDKDSGRGIAGATIIVTFSGKTWLREQWFHAATSLKSGRCVRMLVLTDEDGAFRTPFMRVIGYFGDPRLHYKIYHADFRQVVSGESSSAIGQATHELEVWSEKESLRYDIWLGSEVDHSRVVDRDTYDAMQRDRHDYLDNWLSSGDVVDLCEHEPNRKEIDKFLLGLFKEWRDTAPKDAGRRRALMACDALRRFQLTDMSLAEEFIQLKESALQTLCSKRQ